MLNDSDRKELKRELFKSAVVSAVFSLFKSRQKQASTVGEKFLFQDLAACADVTKAQVSRWFNGDVSPNWRLSTFYDMVEALEGEVRLEIVDKRTGEVHTQSGFKAHMEEPTSVRAPAQIYLVDFAQLEDVNIPRRWSNQGTGTAPQEPIYSTVGNGLATSAA